MSMLACLIIVQCYRENQAFLSSNLRYINVSLLYKHTLCVHIINQSIRLQDNTGPDTVNSLQHSLELIREINEDILSRCEPLLRTELITFDEKSTCMSTEYWLINASGG